MEIDLVEFIVEPPDTYPGFPFKEYLKQANSLKLLEKTMVWQIPHQKDPKLSAKNYYFRSDTNYSTILLLQYSMMWTALLRKFILFLFKSLPAEKIFLLEKR